MKAVVGSSDVFVVAVAVGELGFARLVVGLAVIGLAVVGHSFRGTALQRAGQAPLIVPPQWHRPQSAQTLSDVQKRATVVSSLVHCECPLHRRGVVVVDAVEGGSVGSPRQAGLARDWQAPLLSKLLAEQRLVPWLNSQHSEAMRTPTGHCACKSHFSSCNRSQIAAVRGSD